MSNASHLPPAILEVGDAIRAYQAAVDDFDRESARLLGINETDLRCLEILLQDLPQAIPGELATRLGLTSGSVSTMLDRLEKAGLLTRSPHPDDRRKTIIRVTPRAEQRASALVAPLVTEAAGLLSGYTANEIRLLVDFMQRARELQQRHVERLRSMQKHPQNECSSLAEDGRS